MGDAPQIALDVLGFPDAHEHRPAPHPLGVHTQGADEVVRDVVDEVEVQLVGGDRVPALRSSSESVV